MAISLQTVAKIALQVLDEATDPHVREIAQVKLAAAVSHDPELVREAMAQATAQLRAPTSTSGKSNAAPPWSDVAPEPAPTADDPEYRSFFELGDWGTSSRSATNLVHRLNDDSLVTIFADRNRPGRWGWSIARDGQDTIFANHRFASELEAMRDCWACIALRRRQGRRP
jgi:hypothetical protein